MGVYNPTLHGARLDVFLNLTFVGPRKFLADRLNHAGSLLVIAQINLWHPLAYSCIPFENNALAFWGGYNPVYLCVGETMHPASSSMGVDSRLKIPLSFSHTLNLPYQPLVLVVTVPALQLPFMAVLPVYTLYRSSLTKKVL